jgi:hypothetical protein
MYATKKMVPAAVGVAGLTLASLGAVGSGPANAAATCQLSVDSNRVLNLQDRGINDEIFFKLGSNKTPVVQYNLGDKVNNIGTEVFQGSIDLKVFERDANNLTLVGTLNNIPCENEPGELDDVSGAGALYRVRWSVR